MSGVWQAWTKARHELFVSDPSATVALHGQVLFDERRAFYRAIDEVRVRVRVRVMVRVRVRVRAGARARIRVRANLYGGPAAPVYRPW